MNCGEAKELIQLYLDNELDARVTLEAQRHLESCPACAGLLNQFTRVDHALREAARSGAGDYDQTRKEIMAAIRKQAPETESRWLSRPILMRAAAVVIVALLVSLWLLNGGSGLGDKTYADAASDHADHCTLDKLTMAVSDPAEIDKLVTGYGQLKQTPDLTAFGFVTPRAKHCLIDGVRTLHIVYQSQGSQPLSLFLRLRGAPSLAEKVGIGAKEKTLVEKGYQVASISKSGVDLLVVSAMDEQQTQALLRSVAAQM